MALFSVFIFSRKFTRFHAALKPIFRSLKPFQAFSSLFNLRARVFSFYMNTYIEASFRGGVRLDARLPGTPAEGCRLRVVFRAWRGSELMEERVLESAV